MHTEPPVVLYTEDNFLLIQTVRDMLELLGCRVEHYANGSLALAAVRSAGERDVQYDLLLLDNDLTLVSGLAVAREARRLPLLQHTPIILCALEDCAAAAHAAGVNEFLRKPNNLLTLADTIRRLLAAHAKAAAGTVTTAANGGDGAQT